MLSRKVVRCLVPQCHLKVHVEQSVVTSVSKLEGMYAMEVMLLNLRRKRSLSGSLRVLMLGIAAQKSGFMSKIIYDYIIL